MLDIKILLVMLVMQVPVYAIVFALKMPRVATVPILIASTIVLFYVAVYITMC